MSNSPFLSSNKPKVKGKVLFYQRWKFWSLVTSVQRSLPTEVASGDISKPTMGLRGTIVHNVTNPLITIVTWSAHSHRGETTCVHTVQLFIQSSWDSENTHFETHRRETPPLQSMWVYHNPLKWSKKAHDEACWGEATQVQPVKLLFRLSRWIAKSHEDTHWREAL